MESQKTHQISMKQLTGSMMIEIQCTLFVALHMLDIQ